MVLATHGPQRVRRANNAKQRRNVGDVERVLSAVAGGALALYGLKRRGAPGMGLALLGAGMMRRGATGHCMVYDALGVSTVDGGHPRGTVTGLAATVNARQAVKIERSITIARPAGELYAIWRDFENLPELLGHIESVMVVDHVHSRWVARVDRGPSVEWTSEIVNDLPGELIAWKTIDNPDVAHAGSVHFTPSPDGLGTELRVVLDYEPPAHGFLTAVANAFGKSVDDLIQQDLRRFKEEVES